LEKMRDGKKWKAPYKKRKSWIGQMSVLKKLDRGEGRRRATREVKEDPQRKSDQAGRKEKERSLSLIHFKEPILVTRKHPKGRDQLTLKEKGEKKRQIGRYGH